MKTTISSTFACLAVFMLAGRGTCRDSLAKQRFVCNTGYTQSECADQLHGLRNVLTRYPIDELGPWTWVLVKSADWKTIVRRLGGNPDSPAFSVLEKHETFIEEALLAPVADRRSELLRIWSVPLDQFLELAVTHELGHGICNDMDEARADLFGRLLRQGKHPQCQADSYRTKANRNRSH